LLHSINNQLLCHPCGLLETDDTLYLGDLSIIGYEFSSVGRVSASQAGVIYAIRSLLDVAPVLGPLTVAGLGIIYSYSSIIRR
jgi:hypothetical protein